MAYKMCIRNDMSAKRQRVAHFLHVFNSRKNLVDVELHKSVTTGPTSVTATHVRCITTAGATRNALRPAGIPLGIQRGIAMRSLLHFLRHTWGV